jgi:hypothetical protein
MQWIYYKFILITYIVICLKKEISSDIGILRKQHCFLDEHEIVHKKH